MTNFGERLNEEIDSEGIDKKILSNSINVPERMVFEWCANETQPSFENIIKLANFFNCSIDYLLDREPRYDNIIFKECPPFSKHLDEIIKKCKSNKHAISKATNISRSCLYDWTNGKNKPILNNLIKVADFLSITLDVLVGRQ